MLSRSHGSNFKWNAQAGPVIFLQRCVAILTSYISPPSAPLLFPLMRRQGDEANADHTETDDWRHHRDGGRLEKQYRVQCRRCQLPLGYSSSPTSGRGEDELSYLLPGAVSASQGQAPGDALDPPRALGGARHGSPHHARRPSRSRSRSRSPSDRPSTSPSPRPPGTSPAPDASEAPLELD